jgi:hypothetical protein
MHIHTYVETLAHTQHIPHRVTMRSVLSSMTAEEEEADSENEHEHHNEDSNKSNTAPLQHDTHPNDIPTRPRARVTDSSSSTVDVQSLVEKYRTGAKVAADVAVVDNYKSDHVKALNNHHGDDNGHVAAHRHTTTAPGDSMPGVRDMSVGEKSLKVREQGHQNVDIGESRPAHVSVSDTTQGAKDLARVAGSIPGSANDSVYMYDKKAAVNDTNTQPQESASEHSSISSSINGAKLAAAPENTSRGVNQTSVSHNSTSVLVDGTKQAKTSYATAEDSVAAGGLGGRETRKSADEAEEIAKKSAAAVKQLREELEVCGYVCVDICVYMNVI